MERPEVLAMTATVAEKIAARWRESTDGDNPAGPLYAGGEFAEADMVGGATLDTSDFCGTRTGTGCC
jgi:hypothetical protein